jgi:hypothetical protein
VFITDPQLLPVGKVLADPLHGGGVVVRRVELGQVQLEVVGEAAERFVGRGLLLSPRRLGGVHALVHRLELALLRGGLDGAGGALGVEVPRQGEVLHDERHPAVVVLAKLLDGRVDREACLALEVGELHEGDLAVGRARQPVAVGAHQWLRGGGRSDAFARWWSRAADAPCVGLVATLRSR